MAALSQPGSHRGSDASAEEDDGGYGGLFADIGSLYGFSSVAGGQSKEPSMARQSPPRGGLLHGGGGASFCGTSLYGPSYGVSDESDAAAGGRASFYGNGDGATKLSVGGGVARKVDNRSGPESGSLTHNGQRYGSPQPLAQPSAMGNGKAVQTYSAVSATGGGAAAFNPPNELSHNGRGNGNAAAPHDITLPVVIAIPSQSQQQGAQFYLPHTNSNASAGFGGPMIPSSAYYGGGGGAVGQNTRPKLPAPMRYPSQHSQGMGCVGWTRVNPVVTTMNRNGGGGFPPPAPPCMQGQRQLFLNCDASLSLHGPGGGFPSIPMAGGGMQGMPYCMPHQNSVISFEYGTPGAGDLAPTYSGGSRGNQSTVPQHPLVSEKTTQEGMAYSPAEVSVSNENDGPIKKPGRYVPPPSVSVNHSSFDGTLSVPAPPTAARRRSSNTSDANARNGHSAKNKGSALDTVLRNIGVKFGLGRRSSTRDTSMREDANDVAYKWEDEYDRSKPTQRSSVGRDASLYQMSSMYGIPSLAAEEEDNFMPTPSNDSRQQTQRGVCASPASTSSGMRRTIAVRRGQYIPPLNPPALATGIKH